jgi:putative intracellular protease/amidase
MPRIAYLVTSAREIDLRDSPAHPTGYWAEEALKSNERFIDAGYDVVVLTPDGEKIWVREEDGNWITCKWTALPGMERPLDSELMQRAADYARTATALTDDAADDLMLELRDAVEAEATDRERAEKKKQRADRLAERRAARAAERAAMHDDEDDDFEFEAV